jgi:hypothetical protein
MGSPRARSVVHPPSPLVARTRGPRDPPPEEAPPLTIHVEEKDGVPPLGIP